MGSHVAAVEMAIDAAGLGPVDQPIIEVARSLAKRMDAAEATDDGPGSRLFTSYLTAVRSLTARAASERPPRPQPVKPEPVEEPATPPKEVPGAEVVNFRKRARGRRQAR